jgi:hypothetical protein
MSLECPTHGLRRFHSSSRIIFMSHRGPEKCQQRASHVFVDGSASIHHFLRQPPKYLCQPPLGVRRLESFQTVLYSLELHKHYSDLSKLLLVRLGFIS